MNFKYRQGTNSDITDLKNLAISAWRQFETRLTVDNWDKLYKSLSDEKTYSDLIIVSDCIVCTTDSDKIIGMAFLVPKGNPTDIYDKDWCYIRFVSVDPEYGGQGIGKKLTTMCIDLAKQNREQTIALHTSELMDKARHIYESIGFKILREIDKRLGKRYWLYKLDLTV